MPPWVVLGFLALVVLACLLLGDLGSRVSSCENSCASGQLWCAWTACPRAALPPPGPYTQTWYDLGGLQRLCAVATPQGSPPPAGWPVVLYLSLMLPDGTFGNPRYRGGLHPDPGGDPFQLLWRGLLASGCAVVFLSSSAPDSYFYAPSAAEAREGGYAYACDPKDPSALCYAGGANPDAPALRTLATRLAGWQLDPGRLAVVGYSVGAQMASRLLTSGAELGLRPRAAVLIAGGSLYCYAYGSALPGPFLGCVDPNRGCCPEGLTEPGTGSGAPPVLLVQSREDDNADPRAASLYYAAAAAQGRRVCRLEVPGTLHYLPSCAAPSVLGFLLQHL